MRLNSGRGTLEQYFCSSAENKNIGIGYNSNYRTCTCISTCHAKFGPGARVTGSRISLTIEGILSISPETIGISENVFPIFPVWQQNVNVNVPRSCKFLNRAHFFYLELTTSSSLNVNRCIWGYLGEVLKVKWP